MKDYLKLMRIHHYIKNLLVFAALACSGQFFDFVKLSSAVLGFLAFCAVSSAVYILNDIKDIDKDRNHPVKCKRPLASGKIKIRNAYILFSFLLAFALILNSLIFRVSSTVMLVLYFLLNILYSFGLKNVPIADIAILVSGFLIRMLYGAEITEIAVSGWLYLTVISISFYFALGKRRNELRQLDDKDTRKVLKSYPYSFLDKNMYMCVTLANVFYALWTMDEDTIALYESKYLIFTVPLVLLITMKYSLDVEGNSAGDPVDVLFHDKFLLLLCFIYAAIMFTILYLLR